jgi:hypothetical protein
LKQKQTPAHFRVHPIHLLRSAERLADKLRAPKATVSFIGWLGCIILFVSGFAPPSEERKRLDHGKKQLFERAILQALVVS